VTAHKTLIVIAGPTASGKTALSIKLAKHFNTCILSADSRQFYREMSIGTAAPSEQELKEVKHYFIQHLSINHYYNVYKFETDALAVLENCFETNDFVIVCGGSGLYLDALCYGIDDLPDPDPILRDNLSTHLANGEIDILLKQLHDLDPDFYETVDKNNSHRIVRALEVCLQTGKPYSSLRKQQQKQRHFNIVKYCLSIPRDELYQRINERSDQMMKNGLLAEVETLYPFRHLNALNTVGYKELFDYLDGKCSLEQSITDIKTHTRRYAKRQITWFKRDKTYQHLSPDEILNHVINNNFHIKPTDS